MRGDGSIRACVEAAGLDWSRCSSAALGVHDERVDNGVVVHTQSSCPLALGAEAPGPGGWAKVSPRTTSLAALDAPGVQRCDECADDASVMRLVTYPPGSLGAAVYHSEQVRVLLDTIDGLAPALGDELRWRDAAFELRCYATRYVAHSSYNGEAIPATFATALTRADAIDDALDALDHLGDLELWARRREVLHTHRGAFESAAAELDELWRWATTRPSQFVPIPDWEPRYRSWDAAAATVVSAPRLLAVEAHQFPDMPRSRPHAQDPDAARVLREVFSPSRWHVLCVSAKAAELVADLAGRAGWRCVHLPGGSPVAAEVARHWIHDGMDPAAALCAAAATGA